MEALLKSSLFALFILSFLGKGMCQQCNLGNIIVNQAPTGFAIHGKNEYKVTVTNNCACAQQDLELNCKGFDTTLSTDPLIFRKIDDQTCLVNNGGPVKDPITFNYAWDSTFDLTPKSSTIKCTA